MDTMEARRERGGGRGRGGTGFVEGDDLFFFFFKPPTFGRGKRRVEREKEIGDGRDVWPLGQMGYVDLAGFGVRSECL